MIFFCKDSSNFLNGFSVLAEFTGRGEVIRIDYTVTLRYAFITYVKLADRTYNASYSSDRGKTPKIQEDALYNQQL